MQLKSLLGAGLLATLVMSLLTLAWPNSATAQSEDYMPDSALAQRENYMPQKSDYADLIAKSAALSPTQRAQVLKDFHTGMTLYV